MEVSVLRDHSGNKTRPMAIFVLINDLDVDDLANVWKCVEDTTASEVVAKGNRSCAQEMADKFAQWSTQNRFKLNCDKCKEPRISFVKDKPQFAPIVVNGYELEMVTSAKLLGLTISSNLTWNEHLEISNVIKKASKRLMYFLVPLKDQEFLGRICPLCTLLVYVLGDGNY